MHKGYVSFSAQMTGVRVSFEQVISNPPHKGVESLELESNGYRVVGRVYVRAISPEECKTLALDAIENCLSRVCYAYSTSIEPAVVADWYFEPVTRTPEPTYSLLAGTGIYSMTGNVAALQVHLSTTVKVAIEANGPVGEEHFGLYRAALAATGPAEQFLLLYALLLLLVGGRDSTQKAVDAFVVYAEPGVMVTPEPPPRTGTETIYTRLRNEVGHVRTGTTTQRTRAEMAANIGGLRAIVRKAIEHQ